MKRMIVFLIVSLPVCLQISVHGQTTANITGTIKSPQGALQGVQITFLKLNNEFQGNCISGPDGKFRSQNPFQIGQKIKIRITGKDYDDYENTFTVEKNGNAGEFMLKTKMFASGFVRDSVVLENALSGVDVSYYDGSKLIQSKPTNSQGYYDIETKLRPGQEITVRVSMGGYYYQEQTYTLKSEGRNILPEFRLPKIEDRGLRAFITIRDKKNGKPLAGTTIHYLDRKKSTYIDSVVSPKGTVELKLFQMPGSNLKMAIIRPNYVTINVDRTLSGDPGENLFDYEMEKDRKSAVGPVLLIGTGVCALLGGGMYLSSNSKYNSYKDFGNANRESDFTSAQSNRAIAIVAGGIATGAIIAYIIYKINQKNKEKALEQKKPKAAFRHFAPLRQTYTQDNSSIIGLAYKF